MSKIKTYCALIKPGIILGNLITTTGGFALGSKGDWDFLLFIITSIGLALIIGSACTFNNYIDREMDGKMMRTQHRAFVVGSIDIQQAILLATSMALLGSFLLVAFSSFITAGIAILGFFVYVVIYSFSKYRSIYATSIGSIAGATPPVVGYYAASNRLDGCALILFIMIALWQMPHFFAIAICRLEDYAKAAIPLLPIKKGLYITKIHMLLYISGFAITSCMLTLQHYTGYIHLTLTILLSCIWLWLCIKGFMCNNHRLWARKMFFLSLIVITILSLVMPFDFKG